MYSLTFDTETTTYQKGNPFSARNKLCNIGYYIHQEETDCSMYSGETIEYDDSPYAKKLSFFQNWVNEVEVLIGFNLKFDLHWIKRYGINFEGKRVWDCQAVHFLLTNQQNKFPSLNEVLTYYGLPLKDDRVKEYWKRGFDTTQIPLDTLSEYLAYDVKGTWDVYRLQVDDVAKRSRAFQRLVSIVNQDLIFLQEAEWNGMCYNVSYSRALGDDIKNQIQEIDERLYRLVPHEWVNWDSGYHLSAVLYGGNIKREVREQYLFEYANPKKTPVTKTRKKIVIEELPKLVEPLRKSDLARDGYWKTDEPTLRQLNAKGPAKEVISLVLKRAELEKLRGTYLHGLPDLIETMDWENDLIHGNLNQSAAVTGRLSSTKPNLQNMAGNIKHLFETRFK